MSPQALFGLQFTLSLVVFSLVARWYIAPALARRSAEAALVPLFLVHALRYLPALMSLDWLYATFLAASNELVTYDMGGNWYIVAFYVPVLGVVHVMIFTRLARARAARRPARS